MHDLVMRRVSSGVECALRSVESSYHLRWLELKLFDTPVLRLCVRLVDFRVRFGLLDALSFRCVDIFAASVIRNTILRLLVVE